MYNVNVYVFCIYNTLYFDIFFFIEAPVLSFPSCVLCDDIQTMNQRVYTIIWTIFSLYIYIIKNTCLSQRSELLLYKHEQEILHTL